MPFVIFTLLLPAIVIMPLLVYSDAPKLLYTIGGIYTTLTFIVATFSMAKEASRWPSGTTRARYEWRAVAQIGAATVLVGSATLAFATLA